MGELFIQILAGLMVLALATWFGIGGKSTTVIHGVKVKKTGKWIMIFSVIMVLIGIFLFGNNAPPQGGLDFNNPMVGLGFILIVFGVMGFFIGKVVAWFQRL